MKTKNGKNKLERKLTYLKKYLGLKVEESSNKYLTVFTKESADPDWTFLTFTNNVYYSRKNDWYLWRPTNWKLEKPIFLKPWQIAKVSFWSEFDKMTVKQLIIKLNPDYLDDESKTELASVLEGHDDVTLLKDLEGSTLQIRKN